VHGITFQNYRRPGFLSEVIMSSQKTFAMSNGSLSNITIWLPICSSFTIWQI
jgi:hypothetical protein